MQTPVISSSGPAKNVLPRKPRPRLHKLVPIKSKAVRTDAGNNPGNQLRKIRKQRLTTLLLKLKRRELDRLKLSKNEAKYVARREFSKVL